MKLVIFGATGSIGQHLVEQSLSQGHEVTAFVRNPATFTLTHPNLQVTTGDVLDAISVKKAVAGQEAVLCALGAGRKGIIRAEGTRHIIQAMEQEGVKRFICQTTLGAGDSRGNLNFIWKYVMFGLLLKEAYADHQNQEKLIMQSQLEWTIVRPAAFTNGTLTGDYQHGFAPNNKNITLKISRADVADFMLKQLEDTTYLRKTPGLSY